MLKKSKRTTASARGGALLVLLIFLFLSSVHLFVSLFIGLPSLFGSLVVTAGGVRISGSGESLLVLLTRFRDFFPVAGGDRIAIFVHGAQDGRRAAFEGGSFILLRRCIVVLLGGWVIGLRYGGGRRRRCRFVVAASRVVCRFR